MTVGELSEEPGIKDSAPRRWAQGYGGMGDDAFPGSGGPEVDKDYEIVKLRKGIEDLERESELLKKSSGLLEPRPCVGFQFPKERRGEPVPIGKACETLGVSKPGLLRVPRETQNRTRR